MRFLMMTPAGTGSEARVQESPALMAAIGALAAELTAKGIMKDTGGMGAVTTALELGGGKVRVVDGPFTEAKELVGGYAILEVGSPEEAIALGERFLDLHRQHLGDGFHLRSEMRRLYGPEDFGSGAPC